MEVYNVVIVEDEPYAARHIKALIEKEDYFRVVAVFDNGEDALSSFSSGRLQVELLVTDIQMPGISGLNLIQEIQRLRPGIPSIIISGFGSFSYAKEAISLGTMKYILKPIDVDELREALKEAHCEIKKRKDEYRKHLVWKIQKDSEDMFGSERGFSEAPNCRVLVFTLPLLAEDAAAECAEYLMGNDYWILTFRYSIVLLQREDRKSEELECVAEKIRTKVCGKERHGVFVIGEKFVSGENIRHEIEMLYDVLQDCFYIGETHIITGNRENIKRQYYTNEHHSLTTQLLQQVTAGNIQNLEKIYNKVFDFFDKNKVSVREMRYTLYALVNRIYQVDAESFDPAIECNRIMRQIYTSKDYEDARIRIWKIIELLAVKTKAENEHQDSGFEIYWRIVHFLNANISENYSLQEIADLFHISQPYLSKLFRKYKGGTYKEYCTNLKVQISIKLMKENPDILIKDIAEKVGYDQLYFSTVFYRVMGEYPKQYRNRLEVK